ncbi:Histidine kinase-, DNA gyrase B-, and HSP90-like ATPase [Tenacibaculum sp. 190524A02b]|uniref:tetratricopeptide repeat-containing sensor histidine kinase n=1 Tax=Tenacibaculum vairaonense TaxID=3137860 RepID=UPI0032B26CD6
MRFFLIIIILSITTTFSQQGEELLSSYDLRKKKLVEIGIDSYYKKDTFTLNKSGKKLLQLYRKYKDSSALAKYYHFKALHHRIKFIADSSYYFYHESKKISKDLKDSLEVGRRLLSIAVLQRDAKDFLGSEISSIEALHYLEPIKSFRFLESLYNNLGLISEEFDRKKDAIDYYNKAHEVSKLNNNKQVKEIGYLRVFNNLGLLYQKRDQHKKAIEYFEEGLAFDSIKIKYPENYTLLLENFAVSSSSLGVSKDILGKYIEVADIREKLKDFNRLSTVYVNIGRYYIDSEDFNLAKFNLIKALKYAKQTHNNKRWLEALELLSELSKGEEATNYLKEYIQLNDSLIKKERSLKNQFAKIRYETTKKEEENTFLKAENDKKQAEIVRQTQQKIIGWLMSLISLLGLGFSILFFVFRRRKLLYQAQLQKAQAREQERKQIAKALHDEVAGDLRLLHRKLERSQLLDEAQRLDAVKENVRNLSHQLSSVSFKKVSFKDQIINLVTDYFEPGFRIVVQGLNEHNWEEVDSTLKRLLYICTRESLQNCKKHAEASKVMIVFSVHKKNVFLNITDNGIGFDTTISKKGIGLHNLQERVEELKGELAISSKVGLGTETNIQIPLNV